MQRIILKNLDSNIGRRMLPISSDVTVFQNTTQYFNNALAKRLIMRCILGDDPAY